MVSNCTCSGISGGAASQLELDSDTSNNPILAYIDSINGNIIEVKKWNGSTWAALGSSGLLSVAVTGFSMITDKTGNPIIAYSHQVTGNGFITIQRWNGNTWDTLGVPAGIPGYSGNLSLDQLGNPVLSYGVNFSVVVIRWNGTSWVQVGTPLGTSISLFGPSMVLDSIGNPYISGIDTWLDNKISVYHWDGTAWGTIGPQGITSWVNTAFLTNFDNWMKRDRNYNLYITFANNFLFAKKFGNNTTAVIDVEPNVIELKIFPNPANANTQLSFVSVSSEKYRIQVFDRAGRCVYRKEDKSLPGVNSLMLDVSGLASGLYEVSLESPKKRISAALYVE